MVIDLVLPGLKWRCCCCSHNNALAQAHACGGSKCKGRGISQGLQRSAARVESPLVCTNAAQRSAEDWGNPLRARGAALLRKGFCCCCSARGSELRAGTGPLRWVAKDAHFRPQPGRILPPLKRTPIAYRAKTDAASHQNLPGPPARNVRSYSSTTSGAETITSLVPIPRRQAKTDAASHQNLPGPPAPAPPMRQHTQSR